MKALYVTLIAVYALNGCEGRDNGDAIVVSGMYSDGSPILYVTQEYIEKKEVCDELSDQPMPANRDTTPSMYEYNRPAEWRTQKKWLGDTCYQASIGPVVYEDEGNNIPDYYAIEVGVRRTEIDENGYKSEAWPVIFRRHFRIDQVPKEFEKKLIDEVVSFEKDRNLAKFNMGEKVYEYQLPLP